MIISHNMMAMNAMRQYNMVTGSKQKNTEKLSSGYKINRAADDAAGLAISEKMRRQVRGLTQASSNVQEGIGFVQVADGALDEIDDMLQRINELSVKAANDTLQDDDRAYINEEIQQIKAEMNRVFAETTFNDRKIWDTDVPERKIIDYEPKQALTVNQQYISFDITNENSDALPSNGGIKINADSTGINFSWTGLNGTSYTTDTLGWEDFENQKYTVEAKSLYNDPKFYSAGTTTPLINFTYKINPIEEATVDDIINTINNTYVSVGRSAPIRAEFEDAAGNRVNNDYVRITGASIYFDTAYKSKVNGGADAYSFDKGVDAAIEPTSTAGNMKTVPNCSDIASAKADTNKISFTFNMAGVGELTATSYSASYYSPDGSPEAENIWWHWVKFSDGTRDSYYNNYSMSPSVSGLMSMLTDSALKPGVLSSDNGGQGKYGGIASMSFELKDGINVVGSLSMEFRVAADDTEQTVLDKIRNAFNASTVLDMYYTDDDAKSYGGYTRTNAERKNIINTPVYSAVNSLVIQAGSEAGQYIKIDYEALSTYFLKINNTNVKTQQDAGKAIDEVKYAMQVVNAQRADFGAYQNRLEHTHNNLDNVVENTTAAESQIRDTDMAKAMVQQSLMNILEQAGASMLAQANQSAQGVMTLLG